jgi:uncharacterized membrane protein YdjX (TVP38/TMEM64 family)
MKNVKVLWGVLTFVPLFLIILGYVFPSEFFASRESIRSFVYGFGQFAPIIFIFLQILQVVITPLSHYAVSLAGGFIFGVWNGFLYNWVGRVAGTAMAFYLGRKFGRRLVEKVVKPRTMKKYDSYFDEGKILLFLAYFLPFFPDDELSYLAGVSSMSPQVFLPLMAVGHISGSLSLAYVGSGISAVKNPAFIAMMLVTLIGGILFTFYYKKMKKT